MVNNKLILDAVVEGLGLEDNSSSLGAGLNRTLGIAVSTGRIGPDFDSSDLMDGVHVYAKLLACAGLLEARGDKMSPINYVPTEKGREIYRRVLES